MSVQEKLITLIGRVIPDATAVSNATGSTRFIEDLSVSSINSIMLIALIEAEFGLSSPELTQQLMQSKTIAEAAQHIDAGLTK